ncbi:MAG: histidinol dehydrogenase [Candidatus Micrarchaeota archaeon]
MNRTVESILEEVKTRKLMAVLKFTEKFDGVKIGASNLKVKETEIRGAYPKLTAAQLDAIKESIRKLSLFCSKQKESIKDVVLEAKGEKITLKWLPVSRVGVYAPAGRAPLPSSVIMSAVPAKTAGVKELVLCSPPRKDGSIDPAILVAANECRIKEIYKIGGAQAIGAMAYGCESLSPVDMICGPGNVYVTRAKQSVSAEGAVKIDTTAGPSEVLILADETANPKIVASDMLAQAEHGLTSAAICVAFSENFANQLAIELSSQLNSFEQKEPMLSSLRLFGAILVAKSLGEATQFANEFAPEHLEIFMKNPEEIAEKITNAGAVFIRTGEVFGDYGLSGGNHILPTGRAARFASPVSVFSFMKQQQVEFMSKEAQADCSGSAAEFARLESLEAHARSAETRRV